MRFGKPHLLLAPLLLALVAPGGDRPHVRTPVERDDEPHLRGLRQLTDGGENASLRKEDSIESLTIERAQELLAARRDRMEAQGKKPKPGKKREA